MQKKKNNKRRLGILYFFIFSFLLGMFYTFLVYQGIWQTITRGLASIPFWAYPLWILFSFYFTLALHELGHFISFYVQGIKLRALYLTIFVFRKTEKGWSFIIKPKLWILFGGLVVPDLGEMKTEEDYDHVTKAFSNSLITAPIVTIVVLFSSLLSTILLILLSSSYPLIGIFILNTIFVTLLSVLYIYTFTLSNPMFYGDFVAYKKMKEDEIFRLTQVSQYTMFSLNDSDETTLFLWNKSKELLKKTEINTSLFHTMLISNYLEGIIHMNQMLDEEVDRKISKLHIGNYLRSEQGLVLAYDLAYYHYIKKDVKMAYQLFNDIQTRKIKKVDVKMLEYMKRKSMHIMHIEDQTDFLNQKENLYIGMSWLFDSLFDPYDTLMNLDATVKTIVAAHNLLAHKVDQQQQTIDVLIQGLNAANKANQLMLEQGLNNLYTNFSSAGQH
jgi:hypothetical protein